MFTSDRDGDLELYVMNADGSNVKRLTNSPGYDGGAFFSPDSKQIVFRANHISDEKQLAEYRQLLLQHLVRPTILQIYVMNVDGSNVRQVTSNGTANFCPFFHPDGRRILFASNKNDPEKRNFDLFLIGTDGNGLEQITFHPTFDGFPMFSPDGKYLVFASNRNAKTKGETNIFIADWVENPASLAATAPAEETQLEKHVQFLASDDMKGRLTGSPEAKEAAEYIATEFEKYGLLIPPGQSTPYQQFEYTSGVKLDEANSMTFRIGGNDLNARVGKDYLPTGFSGDASLRSIPAVFAGYGIRATDLKYDDYAGLDTKGKAVIVYRHGPEGDDPKSQFAPFYSLRYKAMTAREQGAVALLTVSPDSERDELIDQIFYQSKNWCQPSDWSPDSQYIIFTEVNPKTKYDLWVMPLGEPKKVFPFIVTNANEGQARFSPDGKWVAYCSNESGQPEIYVQPFLTGKEGKWQVSTKGGYTPRWSKDGKELFYLSLDNQITSTEVKLGSTFEAAAPRPLFDIHPYRIQRIAPWSEAFEPDPDGRRFAVHSALTSSPPNITVVLNWPLLLHQSK